MRIGVIGVGTISTNVIEAMQKLNTSHAFYLSPRSEQRSTDLANKYENCIQLNSNQEVVDHSDIVIVGVLPKQVDDVLNNLTFRADQIIASFVAGRPPSEIKKLTAPATQVAQLIPLPPIELHKGPLLICPGIPQLIETFTGLGDVIPFVDEQNIKVFSSASAVMSTYFRLIVELVDWITAQGIDRTLATKYMTSLFEGLGAEANRIPPDLLTSMIREHETPSGLNESVRTNLENSQWYLDATKQLDYLINVFIPGLKNKN
jgi:pyrroline-5-carboxylate reductase